MSKTTEHRPHATIKTGSYWMALDPDEVERIQRECPDEAQRRCNELWKLAKKGQK